MDARCAKGIAWACIEVPPPEDCPSSTPIAVHVLTLHAQAKHVGWMDFLGKEHYCQVRLQQMQQLAGVISSCTGSDEAVLVLGDFNFDARDSGELSMHQQILQKVTERSGPKDVIFEYHGEYPVTFAEVDRAGQPIETFLTLPENFYANRCLDHIYFWPPESNGRGRVRVCSCERQRMQVPHEHPHWLLTHISDHYGWSVKLILDEWPVTPIVSDQCLRSPASRSTSASTSTSDIEEVMKAGSLKQYQMPKIKPQLSSEDLCKKSSGDTRPLVHNLGLVTGADGHSDGLMFLFPV